jgi:hypothetical protein
MTIIRIDTGRVVVISKRRGALRLALFSVASLSMGDPGWGYARFDDRETSSSGRAQNSKKQRIRAGKRSFLSLTLLLVFRIFIFARQEILTHYLYLRAVLQTLLTDHDDGVTFRHTGKHFQAIAF